MSTDFLNSRQTPELCADRFHEIERNLINRALRKRIEERAYFTSLQPVMAGSTNESIWLSAEMIERRLFRQELQERAYFQWLDECRRVGGDVHGNDLYHWYSAEMQMVQSLSSRSYKKITGVGMEQGQGNEGAQSSDDQTCCAPVEVQIQVQEYPSPMDSAKDEPTDKTIERKVISMKPRKVGEGSSKDLVAGGSDVNLGRISEAIEPVVECETVDLAAPEFADRLVVTDEMQTEVLFVADSFEEIDQIVSTPSFREKLKKFGSHADFVVHSGPAAQDKCR